MGAFSVMTFTKLCLFCRLIFLVLAVVDFVNFAAQITVVLIRNRGRARIGQRLAFWGAFGQGPTLLASEGLFQCLELKKG